MLNNECCDDLVHVMFDNHVDSMWYALYLDEMLYMLMSCYLILFAHTDLFVTCSVDRQTCTIFKYERNVDCWYMWSVVLFYDSNHVMSKTYAG